MDPVEEARRGMMRLAAELEALARSHADDDPDAYALEPDDLPQEFLAGAAGAAEGVEDSSDEVPDLLDGLPLVHPEGEA